jgi:uncharacterized protein (DUF1810 family)
MTTGPNECSVPHDPFDLERFVLAQAPVIDAVYDELRSGRKRSHWIWFVFPQLAALGVSATAKRFGISSLAEARAYLAHPVLGTRLRECCALVLAVRGRSIEEIFGHPDDLKFRSCVTLFQRAAPDDALFPQCLAKYYGGVPDARTLALCVDQKQ